VQELFAPAGLGLNGSEDPCAGDHPAFTQAQCARTGVTAAQYGHVLENPANQYNTLGGGNPNLNPEVADTKSLGIVISPTAISGFTAAFDYYDIKIKSTIGALGYNDILNQCALTGNAALCGLIHRDVAGTLWLFQGAQAGYILTNNQNVGELGSKGVDVNLSYVLPAGNTFFNFNLIGTALIHSTINTGIYSYDCVGLYGNTCGDPSPRWRHMARISWETGNTVLSLGWRMVGPAMVDEGSHQSALYVADDVDMWKANHIYHIGQYNYLDIAVSEKLSKNVQFTFGINNVCDKEPPLGSGMSPNDYGAGFHNTYDSLGRYIHGSLNFTF
jgi:outer membrane receptor protein involved in Fe transport